jgi:hypothetical protein
VEPGVSKLAFDPQRWLRFMNWNTEFVTSAMEQEAYSMTNFQIQFSRFKGKKGLKIPRKEYEIANLAQRIDPEGGFRTAE